MKACWHIIVLEFFVWKCMRAMEKIEKPLLMEPDTHFSALD